MTRRNSYALLIQSAIESSPTGRMTLADIYRWIGDHFEYYQRQPNNGWKVNHLPSSSLVCLAVGSFV